MCVTTDYVKNYLAVFIYECYQPNDVSVHCSKTALLRGTDSRFLINLNQNIRNDLLQNVVIMYYQSVSLQWSVSLYDSIDKLRQLEMWVK